MKKLFLVLLMCSSLVFSQANYVITKEDFPNCPQQNIGKTVNAIYGTVWNPTGAVSAYRVTGIGGYWLVAAHCCKGGSFQVFTLSGINVTNQFQLINGFDFWYCFLVDKKGMYGRSDLELKVNLTGIQPTNPINLVLNGNLEIWSNSLPDGWNLKSGILTQAINDYNGTQCIYLISDSSAFRIISDAINLEEKKKYRISFWFKSHMGINTGLQLYLNEIGTDFMYRIDSNRNLERIDKDGLVQGSLYLQSHGNWGQYIGYFTAKCNIIKIIFKCGYMGDEQVFIDDIEIKEIVN